MTISIVFLSNLHNTEALRLLEGVQLILQPVKVAQPLFWGWDFNLLKCWSVAQSLFPGGNFNLLKCWSVAQPLFWGCNYNLLKYSQLHSHSSKAVISICWNVGQLHSHSSEAAITTCWNVGQLHSHSPLAHQPHCWAMVQTSYNISEYYNISPKCTFTHVMLRTSLHKLAKPNDPFEPAYLRAMPIVDHHHPHPLLRTCLPLLCWSWIGP